MDYQNQEVKCQNKKKYLDGVYLNSAFDAISTNIQPVQVREAFSQSDIDRADTIVATIERNIASYSLVPTSRDTLNDKISEYSQDKYDESNIKKSVNYIPDKNDELDLEYKQHIDKYNMLMAASVVTGLSISVLIGMILYKNR